MQHRVFEIASKSKVLQAMPGRPAGLAVLLAVLAQSCNSVRAEASSVIQLTEGNFDKLTASGEWLVTISAPW